MKLWTYGTLAKNGLFKDHTSRKIFISLLSDSSPATSADRTFQALTALIRCDRFEEASSLLCLTWDHNVLLCPSMLLRLLKHLQTANGAAAEGLLGGLRTAVHRQFKQPQLEPTEQASLRRCVDVLFRLLHARKRHNDILFTFRLASHLPPTPLSSRLVFLATFADIDRLQAITSPVLLSIELRQLLHQLLQLTEDLQGRGVPISPAIWAVLVTELGKILNLPRMVHGWDALVDDWATTVEVALKSTNESKAVVISAAESVLDLLHRTEKASTFRWTTWSLRDRAHRRMEHTHNRLIPLRDRLHRLCTNGTWTTCDTTPVLEARRTKVLVRYLIQADDLKGALATYARPFTFTPGPSGNSAAARDVSIRRRSTYALIAAAGLKQKDSSLLVSVLRYSGVLCADNESLVVFIGIWRRAIVTLLQENSPANLSVALCSLLDLLDATPVSARILNSVLTKDLQRSLISMLGATGQAEMGSLWRRLRC